MSAEKKAKACTAFREALSEQILKLTGTKPRLALELRDTTKGVKQWIIYHK